MPAIKPPSNNSTGSTNWMGAVQWAIIALLVALLLRQSGCELKWPTKPDTAPKPSVKLHLSVFVAPNESPDVQFDLQKDEAVRDLRQEGFIIIVTDDDPQEASQRIPKNYDRVLAAVSEIGGMPAIINVAEDGTIISKHKMPSTADAMKKVVKDAK